MVFSAVCALLVVIFVGLTIEIFNITINLIVWGNHYNLANKFSLQVIDIDSGLLKSQIDILSQTSLVVENF